MDKAIKLLEQAVGEADCVEVLAVVDREYLNRAVRHVREAISELQSHYVKFPEGVDEKEAV
jgi:hypothetical protein